MQAGDIVNYVPDKIHAHQHHPVTGFPWVFGWKTGKKDRQTQQDEVIELSGEETKMKLRHIRRQTGAVAEREAAKLVLLRPSTFWKALVRDVSEDGLTANLSITDGTTGAILNYDGVPVDQAKLAPHSCHEED
jgi:hypothetical protein